MNNYRVSFYKNLQNSDGHNFRCLQRQVDVEAGCPSLAMMHAERLVHNERMDADYVEVVHLCDRHEPEPNSTQSSASSQQTWSRAS